MPEFLRPKPKNKNPDSQGTFVKVFKREPLEGNVTSKIDAHHSLYDRVDRDDFSRIHFKNPNPTIPLDSSIKMREMFWTHKILHLLFPDNFPKIYFAGTTTNYTKIPFTNINLPFSKKVSAGSVREFVKDGGLSHGDNLLFIDKIPPIFKTYFPSINWDIDSSYGYNLIGGLERRHNGW